MMIRQAWLPFLFLGIVSVSFGAKPVAAQDGTALALSCAGSSPQLLAWCQELTLVASSMQRGIGLGASGGSDIPGSPSTLGRRLGVPRVGASISGGLMRVGMPDLRSASGSSAGQETFSQPSARLGVAVGLLDGFQLAPTMGGILSMDLLASYSTVRLPSGAGFDGASSGFGLGGRLGLIRESFTLPGVSVSAMRRWMGTVAATGTGSGQMGRVETDVQVTSFRATVGKNLFALGLLAGVGVDQVEGDVRITAETQGSPGPALTGTSSGTLSSSRRVYFVSGWFGFLVYRVSGEVGYAEGVADPFSAPPGTFDPSSRTGSFDPGARSLFASLAFRITL